jgi:hypothetical protein
MKPLCFVLMPFGVKPDGSGQTINFDTVYNSIFVPAIENAGLEPIRADEEGVGGSIHKPMFERLMICDYALADLTTSNANVFYELGIRHAFRPRSTIITFHAGSVLPFDVAPLRGMPYRMDNVDQAIAGLSGRLIDARAPHDDSPIYQLVDNIPRFTIDGSSAEVFVERIALCKGYRERLTRARSLGEERGRTEILAIKAELGDLTMAEPELVVDMFKSLRSVGAYADMLALYNEMPASLKSNRFLKEQYAAQLNRLSAGDPTRRSEAERILLDIVREQGPSAETNGLLGRVYKDFFEEAQSANKAAVAKGYLRKAIEAYLQGFEADWRDPYPGVNAVTLMERLDAADPRQERLLPVVRYAAERRAARTGGDYWDHATLLEIAVLQRDRDGAQAILSDVLVQATRPEDREIFRPQTTARNLTMITQGRTARGEDQTWVGEIVQELNNVAEELRKGDN